MAEKIICVSLVFTKTEFGSFRHQIFQSISIANSEEEALGEFYKTINKRLLNEKGGGWSLYLENTMDVTETVSKMLSSEQSVQGSVATEADSSNDAGTKNKTHEKQ